jgi:hypothetical protein
VHAANRALTYISPAAAKLHYLFYNNILYSNLSIAGAFVHRARAPARIWRALPVCSDHLEIISAKSPKRLFLLLCFQDQPTFCFFCLKAGSKLSRKIAIRPA